jgi:hypothetical protein
MRDPVHDLFFDEETAARYVLPAEFADPEPENAAERRLFGDDTGPDSVIQAAKVKAFVHALRLARSGQLAGSGLHGDQADAFAACYWGALLGKFLGESRALQYVSAHEQFQRGQAWGEATKDVFNMGYGIRTVFGQAPPDLPLDARGGEDSLLSRSLKAAQQGQLNFQGTGALQRAIAEHPGGDKPRQQE